MIPYDYLTDFSKFAEKRFPPKEALYSKLSDCDIKDKNSEHAQRVFSEMEMENLGDNHDVYLRSDMLLLAENFRDLCLKIIISILLGISRLLVWPGMQL